MSFAIAHRGRQTSPHFPAPLVYLRSYDATARFARFATAPSVAQQFASRENAELVLTMLETDQKRGLRDGTITHCVIPFVDSGSEAEDEATAEMAAEQAGDEGPTTAFATDY